MKRRFHEWLNTLDPAVRAAARGSLAPWFGTATAGLLVVLIAGVLPGTSGFFQLRVGPALALWALTFGVGIGTSWVHRRFDVSPSTYGILLLGNGTTMMLLAASLATLSKLPGAAALAAIFILEAGYYGYVYRTTARHPFGLAAVALAAAGALLLGRDEAHRALFAIAGPVALGGHWLLGTITWRQHHERAHSESLRAAVRAQILVEHTRDLRRLSGAMLEVVRTTHDASNALTTALINAEILRKSSEARLRGEPSGVDELRTAVDLSEQLERLRGLVEKARQVGRTRHDAVPTPEVVAVLPVVGSVLRELHARFPDTRLDAGGIEPGDAVVVSGGVTSLHRILENLVLNACQGDGARRATRVEVAVEAAPSVGSLAIRVIDDGPGFTPAQLAGPIQGFESTKPGGSGLGLYTAERLVRASGGSLTRENQPAGGAAVNVYLRADRLA